MNFDDLSRDWQAQNHDTPATATLEPQKAPSCTTPEQANQTSQMTDPETLLHAVRTKNHRLTRQLFWRDTQEATTGLVLIPIFYFFIYDGLSGAAYLIGMSHLLLVLGVSSFFVFELLRRHQAVTKLDGPLREQLAKMEQEVTRQRFLLRHVMWWYILPILAPILLVELAQAVAGTSAWWDFLIGLVVFSILGVALNWINQRAAREGFQEEDGELASALEGLGAE